MLLELYEQALVLRLQCQSKERTQRFRGGLVDGNAVVFAGTFWQYTAGDLRYLQKAVWFACWSGRQWKTVRCSAPTRILYDDLPWGCPKVLRGRWRELKRREACDREKVVWLTDAIKNSQTVPAARRAVWAQGTVQLGKELGMVLRAIDTRVPASYATELKGEVDLRVKRKAGAHVDSPNMFKNHFPHFRRKPWRRPDPAFACRCQHQRDNSSPHLVSDRGMMVCKQNTGPWGHREHGLLVGHAHVSSASSCPVSVSIALER
mmetsp:Transcript_25310/g.76218  ORF Transcript_25310/g.76218 Transcript_25310/m.76218 type:complete len:262 (-) Transcript_25310:68-853(-)